MAIAEAESIDERRSELPDEIRTAIEYLEARRVALQGELDRLGAEVDRILMAITYLRGVGRFSVPEPGGDGRLDLAESPPILTEVPPQPPEQPESPPEQAESAPEPEDGGNTVVPSPPAPALTPVEKARRRSNVRPRTPSLTPEQQATASRDPDAVAACRELSGRAEPGPLLPARTRRRWTDEQKREVCSMAMETSQGKAAREYGVQQAQVSRWLAEGFGRRPRLVSAVPDPNDAGSPGAEAPAERPMVRCPRCQTRMEIDADLLDMQKINDGQSPALAMMERHKKTCPAAPRR